MEPTAAPLPNLETLILAALTAGIIGSLKWLRPALAEKVPNWTWPVATLALGWIGTKLCETFSATCAGNPLGWDSQQAAALAVGMYAVITREVAEKAKPYVDKAMAKATVGALVLVVLLAAPTPTHAGYDWQPYDCESVGSYVGNKVPGLVAFFQFAGGVGEAVADSGLDLTQPLDFSGDAGFRYLGLGMSVANAYGQAGLSPMNLLNWFASFACRRLVFVDGP